MANNDAPILSVNNIEVVYNHVVLVLKGMSLQVREGSIVALLGSNGAGKSTTLKAISGFLPLEDGEITDGRILFEGKELAGLQPHHIVQKGIFQVMEGRRIFEDLTVEENLTCGAYTRKDKKGVAEDLDKCFAYFPVLKKRLKQTAGYLSGGEQQMLTIARTLMGNPELILVDEPTEGLAPLVAEAVLEMLATISATGIAILLVEQNYKAALKLAQGFFIMSKGRVVFQGDGQALIEAEDIRQKYLEV